MFQVTLVSFIEFLISVDPKAKPGEKSLHQAIKAPKLQKSLFMGKVS